MFFNPLEGMSPKELRAWKERVRKIREAARKAHLDSPGIGKSKSWRDDGWRL